MPSLHAFSKVASKASAFFRLDTIVNAPVSPPGFLIRFNWFPIKHLCYYLITV